MDSCCGFLFLVAGLCLQHTSVQINLEVYREAEMYGDLIVLPFMDRYELLVVKTVAICRFGVSPLNNNSLARLESK